MSSKKTVVCVFGVRKKKVIFETKDGGRSDSLNVKEALRAAGKTDVDLNQKLSNASYIQLQMKDPSLPELGPIDIEGDETIPHGSVVHVQFETCSFQNLNELVFVDENGKEIGFDKEIQTRDTVSAQTSCKAVPTVDGTIRSIRSSTPILQEQQVLITDPINSSDLGNEPEISDINQEGSTCSRNNDLPLRKTKILKSTPLPPLQGTPLEEFCMPEDILLHLDEFVRHWTSDLSKHTDSNPLPSDYKNYALNVIDMYPFLGYSIKQIIADETTTVINHRPLARKLSACLRNRKHWPALKLKRKAANGSPSNAADDPWTSESSRLSSKRSKSSATTSVSRQQATARRPSLLHPPGSHFMCSDAQHTEYLLELEGTKDTNHQKLLLDATRSRRRTFIKEAFGLPAIVKEYPVLQNTEMLLYEFSQVVPSALDSIDRNIPVLLAKLSSYFKMPAERPADEFEILSRLQGALAPNKTDGNQPVISVSKAFGSTAGLNTEECESLKLAVYINIDEASCAFVVGETLQWEVPKPVTTSKCVATLLGAYHAFDRCYPFAYSNVMTFLDVHLLELSPPHKPHSKLFKFEQLLCLSKK